MTAHGNQFQPYPSSSQVNAQVKKNHQFEHFGNVYIQDLVLAGKAVERKQLGEIELSPFQESFLSRGLRAMHNVEDKMCDTINVSIGYSAVLGAKLFAKVEMANDCLQRLDQTKSHIHKRFTFAVGHLNDC